MQDTEIDKLEIEISILKRFLDEISVLSSKIDNNQVLMYKIRELKSRNDTFKNRNNNRRKIKELSSQIEHININLEREKMKESFIQEYISKYGKKGIETIFDFGFGSMYMVISDLYVTKVNELKKLKESTKVKQKIM